jgi:hypothetical protein
VDRTEITEIAEIAEIATDAYRQVAPARLADRLDETS